MTIKDLNLPGEEPERKRNESTATLLRELGADREASRELWPVAIEGNEHTKSLRNRKGEPT